MFSPFSIRHHFHQSTRQGFKYRHLIERALERLTGYAELEGLKNRVLVKESQFLATKAQLAGQKQQLEGMIEQRFETQRGLNEMLQQRRHSSWSEQTLAEYTRLVQKEYQVEAGLKQSQQALKHLEAVTEAAFDEFMQALRNRYHQEQLWSERTKALSTYSALFICAAQLVVFLLVQGVFEPRKTRRLVQLLSSSSSSTATSPTQSTTSSTNGTWSREKDAELKEILAIDREILTIVKQPIEAPSSTQRKEWWERWKEPAMVFGLGVLLAAVIK